MTFEEIVEKEPAIGSLLATAEKVGGYCNDCLLDVFMLTLKPQIKRLVGFGSSDPELRSSDAYDTVTTAILDKLPCCGACQTGDVL
jgi:hypothetical protein